MSKLHALVIDDNMQNLRVLSQLLNKEGLTCTEVSNPTKLQGMLPSLTAVDVVFLDLEMPGLDGFAIKDLLRAHIGAVPIIAYSVHVSEMHVVRDVGFDGFLGKPLDPSRFRDQLERIFNGEAVWERA